MKTVYLWLVILSLPLTTCMKTSLLQDVSALDFENRKVGASAKDLLTDQEFKSLTVEIQYMAGYKPQRQTVYNIVAFLKKYLHKPGGINVSYKEVKATGTGDSLSREDIVQIEKTNRTPFISKDNLSIYLLFTNSQHPTEQILGMAYRNTSAVIYGKSIVENSSPSGVLSRAELETAVVLHEIGHILGLVNKGSASRSDHVDEDNNYHCSNRLCLMYHATETHDLSLILKKGYIPVLDSNCVHDLVANGGRAFY